MPKPLRIVMWIGIALLGALAVATIALRRGEQINAMWLVVAAFCSFALGYRFYSNFISAKVLALDEQRATPAERLENGRDFVPTNKWVVFGHHFAAIAGPGPLVGPVLAAQFGYLPGTLWVLAGAVFGGCVQDFVILLFSIRRDGKSMTEMAREEIGRVGGFVAYLAVISIIIILLGAVALIVVNALKASPWGAFTIAMTIPIALLMGLYLRRLRPGKVLETSVLGFVLVMRLSQHLRQTRNDRSAGLGYRCAASHIAHAGFDAICRRQRSRICREHFSICFHYDCLWRNQRVPFADCQWHDTQADPARVRSPHRGLRRDAGGVHGGDHGDDCSLRAAAGNLFRDQQSGGRGGPSSGSSGGDHYGMGISSNRGRDAFTSTGGG